MPLRGEFRGGAAWHGIEKSVWILLLFAFFYLENISIDKERGAAETQYAATIKAISDGFAGVLKEERGNFSSLIEASQHNFNALITGEQQHFESVMRANLKAQENERENFARLLNKEEQLLTQENELYEFSSGRLIPSNEPTPKTCDPLAENQFLIAMGDTAYAVDTFPVTILKVAGTTIISADKSETGALLLSVTLAMSTGRIIVRIDKNGSTINPSSGLLITHTKSTLLLEDQFGHEVINAHYLNRRAFSITGIVPTSRGNIKLPLSFVGGCTTMSGPMGAGSAVVNID